LSAPPGPDHERADAAAVDPFQAALDEAAQGVDDAELAALLREHWRWVLETQPLRATRLGVRRFDHRLADGSLAAVEERRGERRRFLERAQRIEDGGLSARDKTTRQLFVEQLAARVAASVCEFERWSLSARSNPVTEFNELFELHTIRSVADARSLLARYRAMAKTVDDEIVRLDSGLSRGLVANAESTGRIIDITKKQLAAPLAEWPMMTPVRKQVPGASEAEQQRFAGELQQIVGGAVTDALERYAAFLEQKVLPVARDDNHSGLSHLPVGEACYRARIGAFTTLSLEPQTIHELGLKEIARIDSELTELGRRALGAPSLDETLSRLRGDLELHFATEQEVEDAAAEALALAKTRMGDFFGVLPKTDCVIRRIPAYEAPYSTIAYYRPPHTDGSKPGEYFVNTYKPATRPRYEARVLAVHEAIPGHHLQIAIAQELDALPAFRKHAGFTAYVEGWALYTERFAEEMGMYESDLDRIGVLSFDAWRAGRLVVDTGLHALGWSRAEAKAFLSEHTALAPNNIDNEVDRYISWPGQALGYKIGQLEILALKRRAQEALGDAFDIKAFHDAVLTGGAVSLPVLRVRIDAYIRGASPG